MFILGIVLLLVAIGSQREETYTRFNLDTAPYRHDLHLLVLTKWIFIGLTIFVFYKASVHVG